MMRMFIVALLGYLIFRIVRSNLNPRVKNRRNESANNTKNNFQQKNKNKIEDADFEELD